MKIILFVPISKVKVKIYQIKSHKYCPLKRKIATYLYSIVRKLKNYNCDKTEEKKTKSAEKKFQKLSS